MKITTTVKVRLSAVSYRELVNSELYTFVINSFHYSSDTPEAYVNVELNIPMDKFQPAYELLSSLNPQE